ncbi:MAG: DUF72 domain-containing protein [Verrucomicrobiae bacterium]|nr:DUF72 domain-containing protein [Verrucomicrobiae bacterium]
MPQKQTPKILVGCCGFNMAQADYFEKFRCVEIDSSFYNLPKIETAQRWRKTAPENFQFALKAWQVITHPPTSPTYKRTRLDPRDRPHCGGFGFNPTIRWAWDLTFDVAKALDAFLVLFQCPASFRQTAENVRNLRHFFERAKRGNFLMAWEPRGTWEPELIAKLCRELDLIHVVNPLDTLPASEGPLRYFRLHGRGQFEAKQLQELCRICKAQPTPVYCMFNNPAAASDAQRFQQLLQKL